jgi:hypothetical protein
MWRSMSSSFLRNILFSVGATLFLGSLLARFIVVNSFIAHPISPDVGGGLTVPYEVKGKTVYITAEQERSTVIISAGEISGLAILISYGMLLALRKK